MPRSFCNTDADKAALKKIGKNQLLSYKLVLEESGKHYANQWLSVDRMEDWMSIPDLHSMCCFKEM